MCPQCGKPTHKLRGVCGSCDVTNFRKRRREASIAYKGGRCVACGYDRCHDSLEFHHRDPSKKSFGLSVGIPHTEEKEISHIIKDIRLEDISHGTLATHLSLFL